jgi:hypothetical protein
MRRAPDSTGTRPDAVRLRRVRQRDDIGRRALLDVVEDLQLRGTFLEHGLIHDGVAPVDALGPVSDHLHGGGPRHARSLKVADGRATEIVGNALGYPGLFARGHPRSPEGLDRLPARRNTQGMTAPVVFSPAMVRSRWRSRTARRSGVRGNWRPSSFLVSPGSSRSHPLRKSTWGH